MLTATEIKAKALAMAMRANPRTYDAATTEVANKFVMNLVLNGKANAEEGSQAIGWLGNTSAVKQWGTKHGYYPVSNIEPDALSIQLDKEIETLKASDADIMEHKGKK